MEEGYWFKSNLFEIEPGEDKETNPGCYGKILAEWLSGKFRELGYDTDVIAEDFGWCVMCEHSDYLLWIGCGTVQGEEFFENYNADTPPKLSDITWHVFPVLEVPFFKLKSKLNILLGRLDVKAPLGKLKQELQNILEAEKEITLCDEP